VPLLRRTDAMRLVHAARARAGALTNNRYSSDVCAIADARVAPYLVEAWGYGHANLDGMAAVDPAILEAKGYADVERFKDKTLFQAPMPPELRQRMIAEFEQIKAGF
jgi:hypothetical protein